MNKEGGKWKRYLLSFYFPLFISLLCLINHRLPCVLWEALCAIDGNGKLLALDVRLQGPPVLQFFELLALIKPAAT